MFSIWRPLLYGEQRLTMTITNKLYCCKITKKNAVFCSLFSVSNVKHHGLAPTNTIKSFVLRRTNFVWYGNDGAHRKTVLVQFLSLVVVVVQFQTDLKKSEKVQQANWRKIVNDRERWEGGIWTVNVNTSSKENETKWRKKNVFSF